MNLSPDIWKLLTGVVIFLLAANFLEEGIKHLAGRSFKLFLKKQTANKLKAIGGGAIVTGVLQSSSVVNLMVLAFVGAGVIQMHNALAVMLGSGLGTTFDSWLVATVGFKFNIGNFAYPIAGLSGLVMLLTDKESKVHQWSKLVFGLGFLFVGLSFIKTGMEDTIKGIDLSRFNEQSAIVFLTIGLVITAIIQSSSATIAIVLSALHADAISLFAATAVVLGAEIGTTLKLLLASARGPAVKKRVALGNVMFTTINTLIMFVLLIPINMFITDIVGIKDELLALVFFQSLINILGIILFYPFLGLLGRFLEKRFAGDDDETQFINKVSTGDTDLALIALEKELKYFLYHVIGLTMESFESGKELIKKLKLKKEFESKKLAEKYEFIKQLYGEMHNYTSQVLNRTNDRDTTTRLEQLNASARNTMYAAKNIKDAWQDIEQLSKSSNDLKYEFYLDTRKRIEKFSEQVVGMVEKTGGDKFEELSAIYKSAQQGYKQTLKNLHNEEVQKNLGDIEFSTLVNFNREIYTCEKSVIFALKDYLLSEKEAAWFDDLPGFIR
jgi:phosphate:Na+ symporter